MIKLNGICKTYSRGETAVHALSDVSLKIAEGELIAIMGASGSGKSTLMHVLGLLDTPDRGDYLFNAQTVSKLPDQALAVLRNEQIGFVFQMFNLLARTPALDNVTLPLVYQSSGNRRDSEMPKRLLEEMGLAGRLHHKPNELSGGEQQRVAIARALVNHPRLVLADEPTGNLDSHAQTEIMNILTRLNQQGMTVVLVTHDEEVAGYASRVIKMKDGRIVSDSKQPVTAGTSAGAGAPSQTKQAAENSFPSDSDRKTSAAALIAEFKVFVKQAITSILANKIRSGLSVMGILIGVASVVSMLALGEGTKASVTADLANLGSNLLVVRPGPPMLHGIVMEPGSWTRFTFRDAEEIGKLDGVKIVSPAVKGAGQVVHGNKNWSTEVDGVAPGYAHMRAAMPVQGRFFTAQENKLKAKVAVLGKTVVRELFENDNPIGKMIRINRITFQVIGILPEKGGSHWRDRDDIILIPVLTAMKRLMGKDYVDNIDVEVTAKEKMEQVKTGIRRVIIRQHRLNPSREDTFQIRDMAEIQKSIEAVTQTITLFLGSIAGIALFVGGIGIMNMMLVSVTERTREIGLRKAVGAKRKDIYLQFLVEAVVISLLGGVTGIVTGALITFGVSHLFNWSVKLTMSSVVLAVGFSSAIGILFGLWPAHKAAKLDPITALRYE